MEINLNCNYLFELLFLHWLTLFKDWMVLSKPRTQHSYYQSRHIQIVLMTGQVFFRKTEKHNKKENKLFTILTQLPNAELTQCYRKVHFAFSLPWGNWKFTFYYTKKKFFVIPFAIGSVFSVNYKTFSSRFFSFIISLYEILLPFGADVRFVRRELELNGLTNGNEQITIEKHKIE